MNFSKNYKTSTYSPFSSSVVDNWGFSVGGGGGGGGGEKSESTCLKKISRLIRIEV